ncbi:1-aminocyclopropane-1-carboxylate deaminase/D-cysteine desulfhydrase [Zhouia sp. PK063]|uniref:1-aminocyclopropane-1-carboxylate deaminase/D-cysteine desulfhydrase n=1 Tax=Zhouia sp. PK063 TaxID=3373602 RepID=UPI0037B765DB
MIRTNAATISLLQKFENGVELYIKREDLIHPFVSGNKFRKLKYNLQEAKRLQKHMLITFGGAYSNHIAATAVAGKLNGFKTVGIIRGEELVTQIHKNPTLSFAKSQGMEFKFISRSSYKNKNSADFLSKLLTEFPEAYILPEGGTNNLAIKGCEEIITEKEQLFDVVCCPVGTGGTISGIINSSAVHQTILGFPALKGNFLQEDICKFAIKDNWKLITDYHFGGYAKINEELIHFINSFKHTNQLPLDPVYTGKMMFGITDLISKNYFKEHTKILAIHTGGLQGISGMNEQLKKKQLPLLK